ncbi:MAG TPA: ComEC/Rec2 family competence protein, partial [Candidatus Angelobacter sp.]|nr:ComEC/Rec2 family competence protein [Candidatus Angelobacter sp.]
PVRNLRVQATVYGLTPVHYGDLVLLGGELQQPPRFEQFDYRAYLAEQGIAGVMPSARLIRVTTHPGDPFHTVLFSLRHALIDAVDRALPEPQAALVLGVVFGYRAALPPVLQQQMIASGLIHIVVISGLKVSLLARIIHSALGRWLPRAAPVIAVAAMAAYALLAGASAAALRASAMGVLVVLAGRLQRQSHVFVSLALTAAIMLGLKPALAQDVSFQLSFAGTIGIALMTDRVAARLKWMPGPLRDSFAATVAAEAATWPLMLANFHQVSVVGPAANALVLPLLPLIMVIGGGAALLGIAAGGLAWPALQLAGMIASWFRVVIETLGSVPMAAIVTPYFPARWLVAAGVIHGGMLAGIKLRQFFWQRRAWAVIGMAGIVAIALLLIQPDGRVHVYALDVGTGSAVLIRTPNGHQVLIDGGPDPDKFAQAVGRALPPTARSIDLWLITGGRRENIGAANAVLNRFRIGSMVIADPDAWSVGLRSVVQQARAAGVPVVAANGPLAVDGVSFIPGGDGRSWLIQATASRVAIVPPQTGWQSLPSGIDGVIFTSGGPTEWQGPGHGFTVIQVAANSRQGLPARSVVRAAGGAPILRTDRVGSVQLVSAAAGFAVEAGD